MVRSNYIFELLEANPRVAGFLIHLHLEDVEAVVESVTAHAEKGAGTKTTMYVSGGRGGCGGGSGGGGGRGGWEGEGQAPPPPHD